MQKITSFLTLYAPALLAVSLYFLERNPFTAFSNLSATFSTLGQLAGIAGASLFAWNFILASRLRIIEELFFGLNKVYTSHHKIGTVAFILLLYHPIFLALQYLPFGLKAMAEFLLPPIGSNLGMYLGIAALDVLILSLIITFFVKIKYHLWKLSHQILGVSLFLASIHIVLVPNVLGQNVPLKLFIYAIFIIAVISFTTRNLLADYFVKRYNYKVTKIEQKGPGFREIFLEPIGEHMRHNPGQFMFIKVYGKGIKKEFHPFTLTNPANTQYLSFAPKELGDYTKQLANLKPGDAASIEGPYGKFEFDKFNKNQIWIAGGIGITPFLSGIRSLNEEHGYNVTLYYSAKNENEAVYRQEIEEHCKRLKNIKVTMFYQDTDGFLTMKTIAQQIPDVSQKEIFVCGPPAMMKALQAQAKSMGISDKQMHSDEFALYEGK